MKEKEKGQSFVETALVLPIILFVFMGIVALFHGFAVLVTTHNAASEGGREAAVWRPDGASTCTAEVFEAVTRITPFFDPATDTITTSDNCNSEPWARIPSGDLVEITIVVNWEPIFYSTLFKDEFDPPTSIPLTTRVSVRHE